MHRLFGPALTGLLLALLLLDGTPLVERTFAAPRLGLGAKPKPKKAQRARAPKWDLRVLEVFFADARKEIPSVQPTVPADAPTTPESTDPMDTDPMEVVAEAWSKLISPAVLEDEIKALVPKLTASVENSRGFKGGGYKDARQQFTLAAALFGTIAQYDGEVRWKEQSAPMRDHLGAAGKNCKVGTDLSYRQAKRCAEDLADLVRGGSPELPQAEPSQDWAAVADRAPLMVRMETAQGQLGLFTSSKGEFDGNLDRVQHESQLLGVMARMLREGKYEFAEDEAYLDYARQLEDHCQKLIESVQLKQFDAAQEATSGIYKSCNNCHGDYRG
jgi:hypothetical protein